MDSAAILVPLIVVVALVVLFGLYLLASRRSLVQLRDRVDEAWRDIERQLHQRADQLPGLTETMRGYVDHERGVFDAIESSRAETLAADTPAEASVAENHLQQALRSLLSTAEAYPQLQAGPRFLQLQSELASSGDELQASRRFYNGGVRELNTKIQVFPNGMLARRMGLHEREFFEVPDGAGVAAPPKIQF